MRPSAREARRGLGIWGGISGLGVAIGLPVGGAVVEGIAWQWIFWINVPIGLASSAGAPRADGVPRADRELDLRGLTLVGLASSASRSAWFAARRSAGPAPRW